MMRKGRGFVEWVWEPRGGVSLSLRELGLGVTFEMGLFSIWLGPLRIWIEI